MSSDARTLALPDTKLLLLPVVIILHNLFDHYSAFRRTKLESDPDYTDSIPDSMSPMPENESSVNSTEASLYASQHVLMTATCASDSCTATCMASRFRSRR